LQERATEGESKIDEEKIKGELKRGKAPLQK